MPRPMYVRDKMDRQLRAGNVGEAIFRLWFEERATELVTAGLSSLTLIQQGYNPEGIVPVGDKRETLLSASDPDFAFVRAGSDEPELADRLIGVSINSQKRGYDRRSTMGGYCIKCPRAHSCFDGNERSLWYNRYNIANDYPQFRERFNGIDVILVTLLFNQDTIFKWIQKEELDQLLLDYIRLGRDGVASDPRTGDLIKYLGYSHRGSRKRKIEVRWLLHSEVAEGEVPSFITGGRSQFGRPREVVCVGLNASRDEQALLQYLSDLT